MKSYIQITLLAVLLLLCNAYTEENNVLILTSDDFPSVIEQHSHILIQFYAPWCGHCKKLAPIYDEVATILKEQGSIVKLAKIDCDAHSDIKSKYGVQGFPTLIFFLNGQEIKYNGQRSKDFMVNWLSKKTRDPVIAIEADKIESLSDGKVNILFHGDIESEQGQAVTSLAQADDYNTYYHVKGSDQPEGTVQIFRSFGETISTSDHKSLKDWIALNDRPVVYPFDDRTIGDVFHQRSKGVILFQSGIAGAVLTEAFKDAAEEWKVNRGKQLIFTDIPVEAEHYGGLANYIKIDFNKSPIVIIDGAARTKNVLSGNPKEITSEQIVSFLESVESGSAKQYGLDEEVKVEEEAAVEEQL